jgi:hypothetical protein
MARGSCRCGRAGLPATGLSAAGSASPSRLVRRRRLRGVGRVLVEARGQLADLLLEDLVVLAQPPVLADELRAIRLHMAEPGFELLYSPQEACNESVIDRHNRIGRLGPERSLPPERLPGSVIVQG